MKFNYKLTRQCGTSHGPLPSCLLFDSSGTTLLSPTYNRIQTINLLTHSTRTLPFEARSSIKTMALSPDNLLLIVVDDKNHALLVNFHRGVVLHRFHFKKPVSVIEFSPDGLFFAVSYGKHVQVWHSPSLRREFAPLVLHRTYTGLHAEITTIRWSADGTVLVAGSKDHTARLWTLHTSDKKDFVPRTLSGHKTPLVGVYFGSDSTCTKFISTPTTHPPKLENIYTISQDGSLFHWIYTADDDHDDINNHVSRAQRDSAISDDAVDFFMGGVSTSNNSNTHLNIHSQQKSRTHAQQLASGTWSLKCKHYFSHEHRSGSSVVTAAAFSAQQSLLTVTFSTGSFALYELPSFANIHTLSISNHPVHSVTLNPNSAEWLAFGVPQSNSLLVWEWRSESYILKQQGHAYGIRCMSYSPDGVCIATGGEDGRIKLWNATSGFSFVTLPSEHTAPVTSVKFSKPTVLLSAGLDGVVKAYDLHRYRHFKTLTTPTPSQLVSLDVVGDGSRGGGGGDGGAGADIVVAGAQGGSFELYVWSLLTSQLLEVLSGHRGPVVELQFSSLGKLASASWDGSVRVWDLYDTNTQKQKTSDAGESLQHSTEVVCLAWRPDGKVLCSGTLNGTLQFWEVDNMTLVGEIHGQKDIAGGRKENDRMTSDNNASSRYFTSVCYSADGKCVLAGGNSKYICIYEVSQRMLLKKFQVTFNRSLDGVLDELNSKNLGDGGPVGQLGAEDDGPSYNLDLPGAKRLDDGTRRSKQEVLTRQVQFSSTGREFASVSTEGLHIYSLDEDMVFDPIGLTESITPGAVQRHLVDGRYGTALRMGLHLNEVSLVQAVLEGTPFASIAHVVKVVGPEQLERLMQYISKCMVDSPHLEFYVEWCLQVLLHHGVFLQKQRGRFMRAFRAMFKVMSIKFEELKGMCDENGFTLQFVEEQAKLVMGNHVNTLSVDKDEEMTGLRADDFR